MYVAVNFIQSYIYDEKYIMYLLFLSNYLFKILNYYTLLIFNSNLCVCVCDKVL